LGQLVLAHERKRRELPERRLCNGEVAFEVYTALVASSLEAKTFKAGIEKLG